MTVKAKLQVVVNCGTEKSNQVWVWFQGGHD